MARQPEELPAPDRQAITEQARQQAAEFVEGNQMLIQGLTGLKGVSVRVGEGFTTNMETGEVTVDPSFFVEDEYRAEWCTYGMMHELVAHLRGKVTSPELTEEQTAFGNEGEEKAVFLNVFDDIAGNRRMHQLLPTMEGVARDVYDQRLTPGGDYTSSPRHMQFLDSLLRESMVGDGDTEVSDDVARAIDELRHFGRIRKQDAIEYVCNPNIAAKKRWKILQKVVYPVYERLLEQDLKDQENQQGEGDSDQGQGGSQQNPQPGSGEQGPQQKQPDQSAAEEQQSGGGQQQEQEEQGDGSGAAGHHNHGKSGVAPTKAGEVFHEEYEEYWDKHPEMLDEEQHEELEDFVDQMLESGKAEAEEDGDAPSSGAGADQNGGNQEQKGKQKGGDGAGDPVDDLVRKALEAAANAPYQVIQEYRSNLDRLWPLVEDIETFYEQIISDRVTVLSKTVRYQDEGDINPDQIAQAYIASRRGFDEGAVYQEVETSVERVPDSGGFDFFLAIDTSGSMAGNKAEIAAESAMVITEGLSSSHQRVLEAQEEHGVELGLDVATNVKIFGEFLETLKPSGEMLDEAERMRIFKRTQDATGGTTADYLALEDIHKEIADSRDDATQAGRKKIVIVVTDGVSSNPTRARKAVEELQDEKVVVIGVGIASNAATDLYRPNGRKIDNVEELPEALIDVVKEQIQAGVLERKLT